jgi:hypothetical protein
LHAKYRADINVKKSFDTHITQSGFSDPAVVAHLVSDLLARKLDNLKPIVGKLAEAGLSGAQPTDEI